MTDNDFVETKTFNHEFESIKYASLFTTIQVKVLPHLAYVEITLETIKNDSADKPIIRYDRHLIGKRLTLKYF
jgi:hypothetical protein